MGWGRVMATGGAGPEPEPGTCGAASPGQSDSETCSWAGWAPGSAASSGAPGSVAPASATPGSATLGSAALGSATLGSAAAPGPGPGPGPAGASGSSSSLWCSTGSRYTEYSGYSR